jgi:hypothetical protein
MDFMEGKSNRRSTECSWDSTAGFVCPAGQQRLQVDLLDLLLQDLPGLELHHRALGDYNVNAGIVRVAANASLSNLHLERSCEVRVALLPATAPQFVLHTLE